MDGSGDETFPGTSPPSPGASNNVTLCSNPGLPVAASTVARARPGCCTRISDVQASYLEEGRLSLPSITPPSSQSDSEPVGKLALNLQDDWESTVQIKEAHPIFDNLEESSLIQRGINQNGAAECSSRSQDSLFEILPLELLEDLSIGICSLPQTNKEIKVKQSEPGGKLDGEMLSEQCSTSHLDCLENEKLLNLASLDEYSTDDDIDDGEFYDDQLEAYFEQLVPPEMLRGIQELSERCAVLELLENGLNRVPTVHGAAPRVDATTASNKEAHELGEAGHHKQAGQFLLPKTIGESNRATFRPGLEGISEEPSFGTVANSETEYSQSAENQVISVPITGNGCSIKESGNEDGVTWVPSFLPEVEIVGVKNELAQAPFTSVIPEAIPVYAEDSMNCGGMPESINIAEVKVSSLYLQNMDSNKNNLSEALLKQGTQSSMHQASSSDAEVLHLTKGIFVDDTTPKIPVSENTSVMDTNLTNECELGLADTYLSPTADSRENEYQGDQPHSVVYQNEEGKWVTDLAYYTSFDKEQDINLSEDSKICEDFITGSEAVAMIAQDEQEFERERRFLQVGKIDTLNTTGLADISWKSANSYNLLRASQTFDLNKDASYLCLSLGEFFSQRSEALGCLGGGSDVKRPSFGYQITSPEKKQPVALLRESDASSGNLHEERSQLSDVFPEDGDVHVKEYTNSVSTAFTIADMEAVPRINENINMHTVTESKAEERLDRSKLEYKLPDFTDSVLSISTIASAIANASISADPSQLAAMIMALSNKKLKKSLHPEADKDTNLSTHQLLSSNVENSAFDMEKYLKKTEEPEHGSEPDNFAKYETSIQDHIWDSSLPDEHKHQDTLAMDLLKMHNKNRRRENQLLNCKEMTHEGNSTQDFSCASNFPLDVKKTIIGAKSSEASDFISEYPQPKRTSLTLDVLDTGNISNEKEAQVLLNDSATKKEVARTVKSVSVKQSSKQTSHVAGCSHTGITDKAMNLTVPVPSKSVDRTAIRSTVSISNLKPVQESSIHYPTKAKSTQQLTRDERQGGKMQKRIKEASTACSNDKKYLTSGKLSEVSQKSVEQKPTAPECDLQSSEDEQYSFRPSTSPLIHSSPGEASGTSVSGSEVDSSDTAPCFQKTSCKDSVLLQSVCSSSNISQLTYISSTDSALKNSALVSSVERCWSEDAIELSTTIVRASPTPVSEEPAEKLHDLSWQRNRKMTSDVNRGSLNQKLEEKESVDSSCSRLKGAPNSELSECLPKNENQFAPPNATSSHNELDHVNTALSNKLCALQPLSVKADTPAAWQDHTNKTQRSGLSPVNILPTYTGIGTYMPLNQNTSGEQYIPISSFKSLGSAPETQPVSSVIPTLLTGRSLATTPFAQQYLGNMQSSGNTALPPCHGGSSTGFGLPVGLHCSGIPAGHIQSSVAMGVPLGPSIGPGFLSTASLCNPCTASWNQNILNTNSYTGQPPGSCGVEHWESLSSSGFGHVRVPEELKFPNVCCVGIASQTILSIFNPTERWLQVSIGILSVSVNGEKIDPMKYQCLVFKNKTIVGPHSTEELKILFLPCYPGVFQCVCSVSSWPVSADAETIVQAEALATRVVLTAVAENPNLEVETGKTDGLDFGDLTCGSWKSLPLKLINKTQASVPIRLIINANAVAWRCFTFSKEPVNGCSFQTGAFFPIAAPSVVNHVMHANCNGQDPETLIVWVLFHAPKKHISCLDYLGPADEFVARVDVEVDSLGPTNVINSIPLRARAGTARIHAPQDLQTICLSASVGSSAKQQLPLKNAGNIEVCLKIKTSNQDNCFCVQPEDLFLKPGEEQEIVVTFSPTSLKDNGESILEILVLPSGPQYEVVVKGEVEIMRNKTLATAPSCSDIPPILSNKQFVAWGGVALGRADLQKLTLRNNSPSTSQHLRLLISGQDQDCFQLQSTFGTEERLTSTRELKIRPKEDANIYLMFAPSRVTYMLAKLEIKQLGIQSQPGFKFSIPLCGYGGTSNVILEDVRKVSDCYVIKLNGLLPGKLKKVSFRVRNTGSRAAYVRTLCFSDLKTRALMDLKMISVFPEKFVLKEKTQEVVTITWNPVEREEIFNKTSTSLLATICLFCGDEVSRQQYRRAILCKPEAAKQMLPEHSVLRNVKFDEEFRGEQLVAEAYDLHPRTNYINLFYGNMRKVTLSVVGDSTFNRNCLQLSPGHRPENSEGHINTTLDVLPVKGPQGPSLSLNTDEPLQSQLASQHVWAIQPEHLILTSPSLCGTAETGHLKIMNKSSRTLKFEMSWPAHCLTVTPQHGIIEPESCIVVLVSPNPSLATKLSEFPWSGIIYVHCDNGHKFVKVLIREEIAQDASAGLASKTSTPPSRSPRIHMAKPLPKPPSTKVQIKNRTIVFPETGTGESSENYLEIENNGDEDVKWCLSSFAPPYVKGVDKSGDVYRATYSAFRCSRVFGTIEGHGKEKVIIIFLPRDKGDYTQFWDLECHPLTEPHMKHKQRFQLSGVGAKTENKVLNAKISTDTLIKTEIPVSSRRRAVSEASAFKTGRRNEVIRGVYAPEDLYTFLPTRVGESSTLKVNLRNNSFITHMLKFESPREPFYIKHSKYSLRSLHYINLPVQFKPKSAGRFEALLVVHTDKCSILGIRLCGEALERAGE
ncbi:PREDICTED: centrosomal protein of 192 kDa isoform X2 [Gavialis gangeticus]|uniref:centrosomal protein of 192 kDa isoform X2 n=1 Tax=Gavialis gangeticus TaxID=94835 RepID=UPI00092F9409|nr:PREDICTED: centrosomal protein of 192 kDa isoform X2 [Gavialis gangeticus]